MGYVYAHSKRDVENAQWGRCSHPQRQIVPQGWTSLAEGPITPLSLCPGNLKQVAISRPEARTGCVGYRGRCNSSLIQAGDIPCKARSVDVQQDLELHSVQDWKSVESPQNRCNVAGALLTSDCSWRNILAASAAWILLVRHRRRPISADHCRTCPCWRSLKHAPITHRPV